MTKEYRSTAFKSGNSVAVRFPKPLGLAAGVQLTVREEQGRYIVERVATSTDRIDLSGVYGSCPGLAPRSPDERGMAPRDPDWDGKLLPHG